MAAWLLPVPPEPPPNASRAHSGSWGSHSPALMVHFRCLCRTGPGAWGRGASHFRRSPKLAARLVDPRTPGGPSRFRSHSLRLLLSMRGRGRRTGQSRVKTQGRPWAGHDLSLDLCCSVCRPQVCVLVSPGSSSYCTPSSPSRFSRSVPDTVMLDLGPMGAGCAGWCLKTSREGYPGTSLVETHLELKLRVSRAVENEVVPPRALKGALGRHYLRGLTPWSLISCPEVCLQGARTGLKTASARELLGSAWRLTQPVVTPSQACACSPPGGGGQMVAEMGPSPAHAGQATGMTPKVTTWPSRVSMVPCSVRGEPLEATRQPSEQTEGVPGPGQGRAWAVEPTLQDPSLLGHFWVEFCQGGLLATPTPHGSGTSVWPFPEGEGPFGSG